MGGILFGPSGNSDSFHEQGYSSTLDSATWLKNQGKQFFDGGLDLFEYSFGRGFRMTSEMAQKIGQSFKEKDILLSIHAPYFINFANPEPEMYQKSLGYVKTGIKFMQNMGATRMVIHSGSCGKEKREDALKLMTERFKEFMPEFERELSDDMYLCPETMGKMMQLGNEKEIVDLCTVSKKLMPTFDFGHINALSQGSLKKEEDYQRIFDYCFEKLGEWRTKNAHIHFSKIEYGQKGEIRHLTFEDNIYGPEFEPLCNVLIKNNMKCRVVCESKGTMAEDSVYMKNVYLKTLKKHKNG